MANLFDLTYGVSKALEQVYEGLFTAALTDTNDLQSVYNDDHWNRGTLWILRDSAGAGAAPEGEYSIVSDFTSSSGLLAVRDAFTEDTASGDRYAIANAQYPLHEMISKINETLHEIRVPTVDSATIDSASAKTEYSLPAAVREEDIEVRIQSKTGDSNDNRWRRLTGWRIEPTATGTQQLIIFHNQPVYTRDIQITYWLPHTPLYAYTDKLREAVSPDRVIYEAALKLAKWMSRRPSSSVRDMDDFIDELQGKAAEHRAKSRRKQAAPKYAQLGINEYLIDTGIYDTS